MRYTARQYQAKLAAASRKIPKTVKKALYRGGEKVRGEAVDKHLSGPTSRVTGRNAKNASLSRQSGDLATTLTNRVRGGSRPNVRIGSPMKYAAYHEEGSPGGKIPPRPFLKPSLEEKRDEVLDEILDEVMRAYRQ
jgi:phage gpG-like protein